MLPVDMTRHSQKNYSCMDSRHFALCFFKIMRPQKNAVRRNNYIKIAEEPFYFRLEYTIHYLLLLPFIITSENT